MGRQERPLDPEDGPQARFAHDLRELRRRAGSPSYREMTRRSHYAASTLAAAAAGRKLPTAAVLAAYVTACGGDPEEWERRRREAHFLSTPVGPRADCAAVTSKEVSPPASTAIASSGAVRQPEPGHRDADCPAPQPARLLVDLPAARRGRGAGTGPRGLLTAAVLVIGVLLLVGGAAPPRHHQADHGAWLNLDSDVPAAYRGSIVKAGTTCAAPQITPALIASMLKVESDFDAGLSDPANDEYGIARWTPRVLRYYLPPEKQDRVPVPPFDAHESILAMGRMLCDLAPQLEGVAGDPALNLAAAYRTASWIVQKENGIPARVRPYTDRVRGHLLQYAPAEQPCLPYRVTESSFPKPCTDAVADGGGRGS